LIYPGSFVLIIMERDMFPSITTMESGSNHGMDIEISADEENHEQDKQSRVQFRDNLNMILIPTRHEFRDAKCDLWWVQKDFQYFRTTAENEIRLLAMIKKISFREAKTKLFQPESLCDLNAHDYNFIAQCDPESTEYFVQAFESSGACVPSSGSNDYSSFPSNYSPALAQYPRSRTSSKDDPFAQDYSHLHFCVPITDQFIPLRYDMTSQRVSRSKAHSASTLSSTVESLGETGFFAMMGLFSFAAPLLGYYFLSHH